MDEIVRQSLLIHAAGYQQINTFSKTCLVSDTLNRP
jgi:hypothetical protein